MSIFKKLNEFHISAISSLIRDLSVLSDDVSLIEDADNNSFIFKDNLFVADSKNYKVGIGDVVIYSIIDEGGYSNIETIWGKYVPVNVGSQYIGVVSDRGSTRLYTAQLPQNSTYGDITLQMISNAGGIGYCTGFSPALSKISGNIHASNVNILGVIVDLKGNKINTKFLAPAYEESDTIIQKVLVLGTGTDVGKSTMMRHLISSMCSSKACAAIKLGGTGAYEDNKIYLNAGAVLALDQTNFGLPSTYFVSEVELKQMYKCIESLACNPIQIPTQMLPPSVRGKPISKPEVLFIGMGGDLNWAGIPAYLRDDQLITQVRVLIICAESYLALIGAIHFLRELNIQNNKNNLFIFGSIPLLNPEAFYTRCACLIKEGVITGLLDVNKPVNSLLCDEDKRLKYSIHYDSILTPSEVINYID